MTNEQLALFLRQIANQVRRLSEDIEEHIIDGNRVNKLIWIGEGEPSLIPSAEGYELQPVGRFTAVQMVDDFAETLEFDADLLMGDS